MPRFQNRQHAGKLLADELKTYKDRSDAIVLALPRGGVPVAHEVATALHLPLDVFIVRKLGIPTHEEYAMGAIATGGVQVLNEKVISELHISPDVIAAVAERERQELNRREKAYRGNRGPLILQDKVVILVDDGVATGATIRAAIKALRQFQPSFIVVAVPVADPEICQQLEQIADKVICLYQPAALYAVGMHYENFDQTSDAEVQALLN
jgi:putative phosphoribosyl transferase